MVGLEFMLHEIAPTSIVSYADPNVAHIEDLPQIEDDEVNLRGAPTRRHEEITHGINPSNQQAS